MNKKITVIGGGTGLSVMLRGLKHLDGIDLRAVVTVADDGGSTGRLREYYQMPAMGDLRNVMVALSAEENLLNALMKFRFEGEEDVGGHNLGNLILTALTKITGNFNDAIAAVCRILDVRGEIIPATGELVTLYALMDDGVIVKGEHNIPQYHHHIEKVFYDHDVEASKRAIDVILDADLIVFGIGSLYTSILPNLIISQIRDAIKQSSAKKIYVCNVMSQGGETDHYSVENHVDAIHEHLGDTLIDVVVVNKTPIPSELLLKYECEGSYLVSLKQKEHTYEVVEEALLDLSSGLIRHNEHDLASLIEQLLKVGKM